MTTYIVLINWTELGARNVRESPKRLDAAKKLLGEMGGSFKSFYLTMGECDMVAIVEA
ncbi:MAG: GYD domain-containing protein, partial [Mesorhizobium sp.]